MRSEEYHILVLSRKALESITVGSGIQIKVLSASGNRVKLGIAAPDSVHVVRAELLTAALECRDVEPLAISPRNESRVSTPK